jgi:hypothetical protein
MSESTWFVSSSLMAVAGHRLTIWIIGTLGSAYAQCVVRAAAAPSPGESLAPVPSLPPCVQAGPALTIPPEFPKDFPLPPGTVVTASRRVGPAIVLEGFVPMELPKAMRFFLQKLTAAGFRPGRGEAERGEAEDRFIGKGVIGYLRLRSMEQCPGALQLVIMVQPVPATASPSAEAH